MRIYLGCGINEDIIRASVMARKAADDLEGKIDIEKARQKEVQDKRNYTQRYLTNMANRQKELDKPKRKPKMTKKRKFLVLNGLIMEAYKLIDTQPELDDSSYTIVRAIHRISVLNEIVSRAIDVDEDWIEPSTEDMKKIGLIYKGEVDGDEVWEWAANAEERVQKLIAYAEKL